LSALPEVTYKGKSYTMDSRLRQFRRVTFDKRGPKMEFFDFDSPKGKKVMAAYERRWARFHKDMDEARRLEY